MSLRNARTYLIEDDPVLAGLIRRVGPCKLTIDKHEPYEALVRAIAHQQLHGTAARTILGRFVALYPGQPFPTPAQLQATDDAALRGCGFSGSKVAAIRDISAHACAGIIPTRRAAARLSNAELIDRLTVIRGVGQWTVEMLLMFCLGRMDVLPVDDFGVREGYRLIHGLAAQPRPRELAEIGAIWAPWRSVASWYLWRATDLAKLESRKR